ncbi:hypothetical protein KFL_000100600 [Klebsormidium nitens]|uniref:WW domain-containing protein n=1 Tax=Klebsormidium nitens TaxID=105231 RepID=A0A1Y1HIH8_KLENI|nr:hypothetical protein KFL_000100600 [Klebsormidium nitens]|eukprot:GAQ78295.1 hypothetical protein KFL_000100600 [Klebsormidium nitens]
MREAKQASPGKCIRGRGSLAGGTRAWKTLPAGERKARGTRAGGSRSSGETSESGDDSPRQETERPVLKVRLPGPSGRSLALSACTATLAISVCAFFPGVIPAAVTLGDVIVVQGLASIFALLFAGYTLLAFEKDSRMSGQLLQRDPGLPPDWHTLLDPKTNRVYFCNSVTKTVQWDPPPSLPVTFKPPGASPGLTRTLTLFCNGLLQQLGGILQALVTVGLYWSTVVTLFWCTSAVYGAKQLGVGTSFFLTAAFLALPQPLPFVVLALGSRPSYLGGVLAARFESALCVALLINVFPALGSSLGTIHRAAKARLPSCRLFWNCACFSRLLVALCPALSWRLHPYALRLDYARVALLPLFYRVPLQAPVPRWELLTSSWRAFLYAAPMILPLARLLAAAAAANPQGLASGTFNTLVLSSRPVQISACVSVVGFLFERQRAAYEDALEEKKKELEGAEVENLDKKLLADFDRMLVEVKD